MKTSIAYLLPYLAASLLLCAAAHAQHAHDAHEHGVARLNVALEGGRVEVEFRSPAENLVGFERAPRTDAEREAAARVLAVLRDGERMLVLPPPAHCRLVEAEVEAPEWDTAAHADYEARYAFDCHNPAALDAIRVGLVNELREGTVVRVQLIGASAQQAVTLERGSALLRLR